MKRISNQTLLSCKNHIALNVNCSDCLEFINIVSKIDYFEIFCLEKKFNIDKCYLRKQYYKLQKLFHPDKFIDELQETVCLVLKNSAYINEAYQNLDDDLLRATYLIDLFLPEGSAKVVIDADFMEQSMTLHERKASISSPEEKILLKKTIFELMKALWINFESYTLSKRWTKASVELAKIKIINKAQYS